MTRSLRLLTALATLLLLTAGVTASASSGRGGSETTVDPLGRGAGEAQKRVGGSALAKPFFKERYVELAQNELGEARVSCGKGGRVISGGAYFVGAAGTPNNFDNGKLVASMPVGSGTGWYAQGRNLANAPRRLAVRIKCIPKVRPTSGKIGSRQLADYEVETRTIPLLSPGAFDGGTLACDGPGRAMLGGAAVSETGEDPVQGYLSSSSAAGGEIGGPDGNPDGWYAAGVANPASEGETGNLFITVMCLPDTAGERVGSDDLVPFERQQLSRFVEGGSIEGGQSSCRRGAEAITGGAYLAYRQEGSGDLDPTGSGSLIGSGPHPTGSGWYGSSGNLLNDGSVSAAVESYCLPTEPRVSADELAKTYLKTATARITSEQNEADDRHRGAIARCQAGDRPLSGGVYFTDGGTGEVIQDASVSSSYPEYSTRESRWVWHGRGSMSYLWFRDHGDRDAIMNVVVNCLPRTPRASDGVGADDLAQYERTVRTFDYQSTQANPFPRGGGAVACDRGMAMTGGASWPVMSEGGYDNINAGRLSGSAPIAVDPVRATGGWYAAGQSSANAGRRTTMTVIAMCLPPTDGERIGSDDLQQLEVNSTRYQEADYGSTRCPSAGSRVIGGGAYVEGLTEEGNIDPTTSGFVSSSVPQARSRVERWLGGFWRFGEEGANPPPEGVVTVYCLPR